jgi:hypothetical protein
LSAIWLQPDFSQAECRSLNSRQGYQTWQRTPNIRHSSQGLNSDRWRHVDHRSWVLTGKRVMAFECGDSGGGDKNVGVLKFTA